MGRSNASEVSSSSSSKGLKRHNRSGNKFSAHSSNRPDTASSNPKFITDGLTLIHINGKDKIRRNGLNKWQSVSLHEKVMVAPSLPPVSPPVLDTVLL